MKLTVKKRIQIFLNAMTCKLIMGLPLAILSGLLALLSYIFSPFLSTCFFYLYVASIAAFFLSLLIGFLTPSMEEILDDNVHE
jgi:hypothetical protein